MLALLLIASAPAAAAPVDRPCRTSTMPVSRAKPSAGLHPLGQEPPTDAYKTAYREVDGCPKPVLVRRDIGTRPRR